MRKRWNVSWLCSALLIASLLLTGIPASDAQTTTQTYETYTWQLYNVSLTYPDDWQVIAKGDVISVRPIDRDVSDGFGPEFILFAVPDADPDDLDAAARAIAETIGGVPGETVAGRTQGRASRTFVYTRSDPGVVGSVLLVALDDQTVVASAYVMRSDEPDDVTHTLRRIMQSLTFDEMVRDEAPVGAPSVSVASVQLPQHYAWDDAGLALYFPEDWQVSRDQSGDLTTLFAVPLDAALTEENRYNVIQASLLLKFSGLDVRTVAEVTAHDYDNVSEIVEMTVAGYPAATYDLIDDSETPALHLRTITVGLPDREAIVLFVFGAEQTSWDRFRPVVSAFISSVEQMDERAAQNPSGDMHVLAARVSPDLVASRWQDSGSTRPFIWEDYGVSFEIPEAWQSIVGGQDFDLALVSPEALESNAGAFVIVNSLPSIGPGQTIESALEPIASQLSEPLEAFSANGVEGAAVKYDDAEAGTTHHLVLLPYGTRGAALYIQTTAATGDDTAILGILDSITIDPPMPDCAVVDAAWQASLAEQKTLLYGDPSAPVTMLEFFDFTCGHCASYSADVERLIALEVDPGDLYLEIAILDTIGGSLSNQAAQATYCATEQGKGYTAYKALFHGYMSRGYDVAYSREGITDLLSNPEVGLDVDALNACIDGGTYADVIGATRVRAADAGVTGTPSVLLAAGEAEPAFVSLPSGDRWSGGIPLEVLRPVIDEVKASGVSAQEAVTNFFGG